MSIIFNALRGFLVVIMLFTSYPQKMWITSGKVVNKNIIVATKNIGKNLDYFKEDIRFPVVSGGNVQKNIDKINSILYNDILLSAQRDENVAEEQFNNKNSIKPLFPYEVNSKFTVAKNDEKILSLYNDFYEYLGGAHGNTVRTSYTIDKSKERIVGLNELFTSGYDYKTAINKAIIQKINKNPNDYFYSGSNFKGIEDNIGFFIKDDELIIYYQLYEIAPYVAGIPEFEIPLELFSDNYIYK